MSDSSFGLDLDGSWRQRNGTALRRPRIAGRQDDSIPSIDPNRVAWSCRSSKGGGPITVGGEGSRVAQW